MNPRIQYITLFQPNKCKVLNRDQCAEGSNGVSFIPDDQRDPMDNPFPKVSYWPK